MSTLKKKTLKKGGAYPCLSTSLLSEEEKELLVQHKTLKLLIELVPKTCWYSNVRSIVKQSQWVKIRKEVYAKANFLCEICGEQGTRHPVECHEVWAYDEEILTQRLDHFLSICPLCHEVKHIGSARNRERALFRFTIVNNLNKESARKIIMAVFKEWEIRSRQDWEFDIELLKNYNIDIEKLQDRRSCGRIGEKKYNGDPKLVIVQTGDFSIEDTTAILDGRIVCLDRLPIIEYGHCWSSTTSTPTIKNNLIMQEGRTRANFSSKLPLTSGTTFYFRAFVRNENFIKYGSIKTLITP